MTAMSISYVIFLLITMLSICRGEQLFTGEDVKSFVSRMIDENEVMVFAKRTCSLCNLSRALLKTMKAAIDFEVNITDLDLMPEEDDPLIQMELLQRTNQTLVPNVLIGSKHVGGHDELQKLAASGRLQELLTDVVNSRSSVIRAKIAGNEPSAVL